MTFPNFAGVEIFALQWVALIPLLFVWEGRSVKKAFSWGLWMGFVVNAGGFYWITNLLLDFGHLPLWAAIPICGLNALYQGLVFGLWGGLTAFLRIRCGVGLMVCAPVVLAIVENLFPLVFPWYFANGQYLFHPVVQMVEWTGIPGLTWLLVLVNCGLFMGVKALLEKKPVPRLQLALPLVLLGVAVVYGNIRIAQVDRMMAEAPSLKVGMVEANVGIFEKEAKGMGAKEAAEALAFNLVKHQRLSAELEKEGVDLIVWPESSYIPRWAAKVKTSHIDAIAVGDNGSIYLKGEEGWRAPPVPVPKDVFRSGLRAIWAGDEERVYGVGDEGLVVFFDGKRWTQLDSGVDSTLYGVTGFRGPSGKAYVWMVGEGGQALTQLPDGTMKSGVLGDGDTLRGISSTALGSLTVAVGDGGAIIEVNRRGWSKVSSPTSKTLHGVWVSETKEAWAVGDEGLFKRSSSGTWSKVPNAPAGLTALWAQNADGVYVGGESGLIARYESNGGWQTEMTGGRGRVAGLSGGGGNRVLAVRTDGTLLERNESAWNPVEVPGNAPLRAVVGLVHRAEVWLPHDVTSFYKSDVPLPAGSTARDVAVAERRVPNVDKMSPQRGFSVPVLFGILLFEGDGQEQMPFNSTLLLDERGKVLGTYDKNHLLVFGEYIPGGEWFPQVYDWVPQASRFYPGTEVAAFDFQGFKLGPLVCYEDIIPSFSRRVAEKGIHVFVNITNDAWFGKTAEPYLHLALATFRTVENRKMMIRATNTGVSAYVDAVGRIVAETSLDGEETLVREVPMLMEDTFYTRYGNVFLVLCYGLLSLCFLYGFWPSKNTARSKGRKRKA